MKKITVVHKKLPEDALFDLLNRDAALWVCSAGPDDNIEHALLAQFMVLPWKLVLCEPSSVDLVSELKKYESQTDSLSRHRGFVHLVASDPSTRQLPARALPIFLLNGRADASDRAESPRLTGIAATRRRLNMLERVEVASPKRVFVVGSSFESAAEQLADLWTCDFRTLLTFVVPPTMDPESITKRFELVADLSSITVISIALNEFFLETIKKGEELLPDSKIVIRVRDFAGNVVEADITDAELIEQPLLDKFEIIKSKDLRRLTDTDLTVEDLDAFFDKSRHTWRPFSAGLPWLRDKSSVKKLLNGLKTVHENGSDEKAIYYVLSESGAGGTTIARALAFEAALAGYPTILAKSHLYAPNSTEVRSFIYRALKCLKTAHEGEISDSHVREPETPWLIVMDREQWDGQEQALISFMAELVRSGRSFIILKVLGPDLSQDVLNFPKARELCYLTHELHRDEVIALGEHLNKFLKPLKAQKGMDAWLQFWEYHKPDIETNIAAFWITLEFWLKGLINLEDSIQGWVLKQFREAPISQEVRLIIMEIAVLSIERRAIPEQLLPIPKEPKLPLSVVLENVRASIPALALVRQNSPQGRFWAMAHDVLGRYLINAVYYDRALVQDLNLEKILSPVELRLYFISQLTQRIVLGEQRFVPYAVQFAIKTLKLDEPEGNAEFFLYWRDIIGILENFPLSVRQGNRTFLHHVAISRRRVAKNDRFGASVEEKRFQLKKAIGEIEFSLKSLEYTPDDESNLNLYNSLALAYQDLAQLELEQDGVSELVNILRKKANEATLNALRENPTSSYVLETAARNLLQQGKLDSNENITYSAQALGYVFQASTLDSSISRQRQLGRLATEALMQLRVSGAAEQISRMIAAKNPMGFLASAWLKLTADRVDITTALPSEYNEDQMQSAVEVLKKAPRHWLIIRLQYDLFSALEPSNFDNQLSLLDELESMTTYRMSLQFRLERSILLHIVGRHLDANEEFRRLRQDLKEQNAFVFVPTRLRWLLGPDRRTRLLCTARVLDNLGYRSMAQVVELKNAQVPFVAQDFGRENMPVRMVFKCHITFGAMGPFIKPPSSPKEH